MHTLVGLHYSPWTEKARWALEHHSVPYRYEEYLPMLGEPRLRLRARRPFGKVTVPVLIDGEGAVFDSCEIARFAQRTGKGAPLFPADREPQVRAWTERGETALRAWRGLLLHRVGQAPAALAEMLPGFIPEPARPHLTSIAKLGTAFIRAKYRTGGTGTFEQEGVLRDVLDALRAGLDGGRKSYLLGEFTFADIAMGVVLQAVRPVRHPAVTIGEASRSVLGHEELARQYGDLLAWRDSLYAKHRAPSAAAATAA